MTSSLERSTLSNFDENLYLAANPDVADAIRDTGDTAYDHFLLYGIKENRMQMKLETNLSDK